MIIVKRFTASWCAPCKMLAPVLTALAPQFPEVLFETIDIDVNSEMSTKFNIRSVPTVVILKDEIELHRLVGVQPKQTYIDILTNIN